MIVPYLIHILIIIGIYLIVSLSLNLTVGYTGLLNLGHIALFGIGAYSSALLTLSGVPFVLALILSGLITIIFGLILIFMTKKLKSEYFALATLAFSYIITSIQFNWLSLTNGAFGLSNIPKVNIFGIIFNSTLSYLILVLIVLLIVFFVINRIVNSSFGRLLKATRDDELGLRVLGKNTLKLKYKSIMISAFIAGIAGSLFAHYISFIDPASFVLYDLLLVLTIVIAGGLASLKGTIIASVIIIVLPELLRFFAVSGTIIGPIRSIVYGVILLVILLFKPRGLFGRVDLQ